jgi:recombination protein RecT
MAVNNSLVKQAAKPTFSVFITQGAVKQKINEMMGGESGQRFMTQIISAVTANPNLATCEHMSILNCAFLGESLKLSPSPQLGQYYMVPFEDRKNNRTVATFQLGYKGYIQLALRSGYYKKLNVLAIKEGELANYDPLNEEITCNIIQDEAQREAAPTIGYYAMFEYLNGFRKAMYWSKAKMESHALKYSQGYAADKKKGTAWTFWTKDFDGMAYKTMLRQLISKWGVMSIDLQNAFESDMTFKDSSGTTSYVEETPDTQEQIPQPDQQQEQPSENDTPDFLK